MAHNLTEANAFTADVSVPDAGDARNAASVNTAFQALANRTKYLNDQKNLTNLAVSDLKADLTGFWIGVRNVSSSDGVHIVVAGFQARRIGSVNYVPQSYVSVAPGSDSNSTWHYLYGYESLGAIAYERSTTGPDVSYTFKTGDTSRVFVCSYYVNGSGAIKPFYKTGNKYTWRRSAYASLIGINIFTNTSYGPKDLSQHMSPLSKVATVTLSLLNSTATSNSSLSIRTNGDTANAIVLQGPIEGSGTLGYLTCDIETDDSRIVEAKVAADAGSPGGFIYVNSFYE